MLILLVVTLISSSALIPFRAATRITDTYDNTDENLGDRNPVDYEAMEFEDTGCYEVEIVFIFKNVDTSKDAYKLDINYVGHEQGYWVYTESIIIKYRWGSSGDWTWHLTCDSFPYDGEKTIRDLTSNRLEVIFYYSGSFQTYSNPISFTFSLQSGFINRIRYHPL